MTAASSGTASARLRPWEGRDLEPIEARDVVLLGPQPDAAIRQEGAVLRREQPGVVEENRELIVLGDEAELVPMIAGDVGVGSPDPLHLAVDDAEEVDPFFQRARADDVIVVGI